MNYDNLTEHELELKSVGVNFSIMAGSDFITKELQKNIKEFNNLEQENINKIFFIVAYTLLFNAQRIIWDKGLAENEKNALIFEKYLFERFVDAMGENPMPFIKDLSDYIMKDDDEHEQKLRHMQHIGSKLCKEFNKKDVFLMLEIVTIFSAFLGGFYESIKGSWNLPNSTLEKMLEVAESSNKKN